MAQWKAYIANNLSLFLGQKHLWGVNKGGVLWNSLLVSFSIFQLKRKKTCHGSLDLWTSTTETHIYLKELAGVIHGSFSYGSERGKNKEPTYITGQSIGLFSSLVTWCDHGREAAFSFGLLILLCVLQLPKSTKSVNRGIWSILMQNKVSFSFYRIPRHHLFI